jgi:hypothetical protein
MLSATPHFEPTGLEVAAIGAEIVAQLDTITHAITAAIALNVRFIINELKKVNNSVNISKGENSQLFS